ncbi:hypothetical protein OEZ85_002376 [Tetradesmus obliquus]|uniref:Uncharacterized protein n=1 Tax=Tetradesmus obliquus TaxID=3088 RepID=A0ABY8U2S6_TETOB|nr:hypothetical protein OEZ85_002376 [Tetradesmus obliquus]
MDTGEQGSPAPQQRVDVAQRLALTPWQVGSYPWGPIATAISEAVAMAAAPAPAADAHAAGSAAAAADPWELYQQQHEAARASLLSNQQQRWWLEVGQCSQAPGGNRALQRLLQLQQKQQRGERMVGGARR